MSTNQQQPQPPSRKPGIVRRFLRLLVRVTGWTIVILLALATAGVIYETFSAYADRASFSPPGRLIDVGGYKLHLRCTGEGSPVVVFDAGLGSHSLYWRKVEPEVAAITTACSFDRAGYGFSDLGPEPRTTETIAGELNTLLRKANVRGPLVLVGWSFGGFTARYYAHRYPDQVAGVVFVDSGHEDQFIRFVPALIAQIGSPGWRSRLERAVRAMGGPEKAHTLVETTVTRLAWLKSRLGIARWSSRHAAKKGFWESYPDDTWRVARFCELQHGHHLAILKEQQALEQSEEQMRKMRSLGSVPLVVIARGANLEGAQQRPGAPPNELERIWRDMQSDLLSLSTNSRLVVALGSDHLVPHREPALIAQVVKDLVLKAR